MEDNKHGFIDPSILENDEAFKQFFEDNQEVMKAFFPVAKEEFIQRVEFRQHPKGGQAAIGIWFYPKKDWEDVLEG